MTEPTAFIALPVAFFITRVFVPLIALAAAKVSPPATSAKPAHLILVPVFLLILSVLSKNVALIDFAVLGIIYKGILSDNLHKVTYQNLPSLCIFNKMQDLIKKLAKTY